MKTIDELEKELGAFVPKMKDDNFAIEVIKEGFKSAREGNFGVGAILVDENNKILFRGHNQVFTKGRSDYHSEMHLINQFETKYPRGAERTKLLESLKVYTSLESCPMCLCRMITAGIKEIYHIADDDHGGVVRMKTQLPVVWQELSIGRTFKKAECSPELSVIAEELFLATIHLNNDL